MTGRVWFGPAGSDLLGDDVLGRPVVGDEAGVTTMQELPIKDVTLKRDDGDATSRDDAT